MSDNIQTDFLKPTVEELKGLVDDARRSGLMTLRNLDLSECPIANLDFSELLLENIVFSRHIPEVQERKMLFNVSFEGATLRNVKFEHAILQQCSFDRSRSFEMDFFYSDLEVCRFRGAELRMSDFRWSKISDCSLSRCLFAECDFYMCAFKGVTTLHDTTMEACSITDAVFENNVIRIQDIKSLLQENYETYMCVLGHTSGRINNPVNPTAARKPEVGSETKARIAAESADAYLALSGIYQGKGYMEDSNKAYKRANDCRLRHYLIKIKNTGVSRKLPSYLLHVLKYSGIAMMGYGYQWWKVCVIFLIIALAGGAYMHYCVPSMNIMEAYARGLNNSMGPQESFAEIVGNFLYSSTHSALGLLIIGFLGFILANKVRNNS